MDRSSARPGWLAALVIAAVAIAACATAREHALQTEAAAHESVRQGDLLDAIQQFTAASQQLRRAEPYRHDGAYLRDDARIHAHIAGAYAGLKDAAAAIRHYEESVKVWPEIGAFDRLVDAYRRAGQRDKAEQAEARREAYRFVSDQVSVAARDITRYEGEQFRAASAQLSRQAATVYRRMGYEALADHFDSRAGEEASRVAETDAPSIPSIAAIATPPPRSVAPVPRPPAAPRTGPPPPAVAPPAAPPSPAPPRESTPPGGTGAPTTGACPPERLRERPGVVSVVLYADAVVARTRTGTPGVINLTLEGPGGALATCRGQVKGARIEKRVSAPFVEAYCHSPASLAVQLCTTSSRSGAEGCLHPAPPGTYQIVAESPTGPAGAPGSDWAVRGCAGAYGSCRAANHRPLGRVGPGTRRIVLTQELPRAESAAMHCSAGEPPTVR